MRNEDSCVAVGLKVWKTQIDRADKLFGTLSSDLVVMEVKRLKDWIGTL
jgi:hypothetical protein